MTIVTGIHVGHDSSIATLDFTNNSTGDLTVYESERYTKIKHQAYFPLAALKFAFKDLPSLQKSSAKEIAISCHNHGAIELEKEINDQRNYESVLKLLRAEQFSSLNNPDIAVFTHHYCHAMSALFFSPFEESIIVVADGVGSTGKHFNQMQRETDKSKFAPKEDHQHESISVYLQKNTTITLVDKVWSTPYKKIRENLYLASGLGNLYGSVGSYIFGSWRDSGKVMGLAAYAPQTSPPVSLYEYLDQKFLQEKHLYKGKKAFDEQPIESFNDSALLANITQNYFEEEFVALITKLKYQYPHIKNLIIAGGCALNCLTNTKLVNLKLFDQVFIPPCPNDEGISIGAAFSKALDLQVIKWQPKNINSLNPYLGSPSILKEIENEEEIKNHFQNYSVKKVVNPSLEAANLIAQGEVLAWFQGRSECGPRALGNRSLLSLPGIKGRKKYINDFIKNREAFRPYGCTVTLEDAHRYFHSPENYQMPFMSFAPLVREEMKEFLSEVTHADNTSRIQTISPTQNERYYLLIKELQKLTGHPLVLNTSLNIMGQPILETIKDAGEFFKTSKVNYMVVGNYLITKNG